MERRHIRDTDSLVIKLKLKEIFGHRFAINAEGTAYGTFFAAFVYTFKGFAFIGFNADTQRIAAGYGVEHLGICAGYAGIGQGSRDKQRNGEAAGAFATADLSGKN